MWKRINNNEHAGAINVGDQILKYKHDDDVRGPETLNTIEADSKVFVVNKVAGNIIKFTANADTDKSGEELEIDKNDLVSGNWYVKSTVEEL